MKKLVLPLFLALIFCLAGCQAINSIIPVTSSTTSGTILMKDDFSQNTNEWGVSSTNTGSVSFIYQGLDIKVDQINSMLWSVAGNKFGDVKIDVDAVLLNGTSNDAYGAICRYQDKTHFYGFLVTHDGYYGIFKMQDGQIILTDANGGLKFSEAIRQGGVVNHIQAVCQGNDLSLVVNDQLLAAVEDDSYSTGQIGLVAGTYETPGVEVFFDNLSVVQP